MTKVNDLTGKVFAKLRVVRFTSSGSKGASWLCRCECGQEKVVRADRLVGGRTKSCGNCPNRFEHLPNEVTVIWLDTNKGSSIPCLIDTKDFDSVIAHRWVVLWDYRGKTRVAGYAMTKIEESGKRRTLNMHQMILGSNADHKNRDGLDNRRENLRPANASQQGANRISHNVKQGFYRGVRRNTRTNKFEANIKHGDKQLFLGSFATPDDAARAYNDAAVKYFGEFAVLNELEDQASTVILRGVFINGPLRGQRVQK